MAGRYDAPMRYVILALVLAACSASSAPAIGDAAARCEPGVRYDCECGAGRPKGQALCSKAATPGGCECQGATPVPEDDGGASDANCSAPTTYYRDLDGDGFGSGVPTPSCSKPVNYALKDGDCDDTDARAFPGQVSYFDTPRADGTFDFTCSGAPIEKRWTTAGSCDLVAVPPSGNECRSTGSGIAWYGEPPECGQPGPWLLECLVGCSPRSELRIQACR